MNRRTDHRYNIYLTICVHFVLFIQIMTYLLCFAGTGEMLDGWMRYQLQPPFDIEKISISRGDFI